MIGSLWGLILFIALMGGFFMLALWIFTSVIPDVEIAAEKRAEPPPELVPHAVWRINLDAQLDQMTLADPTIDHDLLECWTPAPKSKEAARLSDPREYQRDLIRKSLAGTTSFVGGGYEERVEINTWGQAEPLRVEYRRQPAIVIDTDEMVAANDAAEFASAAARAAEDAMPRSRRYDHRGFIV